MVSKLFVNKMYFKSESNIDLNINGFERIDHLFSFQINDKLNCIENEAIPRLVLPQIKTELNINLMKGYYYCLNNNKIIQNYDEYRDNKWFQFLKCLQKNEVIAQELPHFVCVGGIVSNFLTASYKDLKKHNKIFVQKFRGVIYLFRDLFVNSKEITYESLKSRAFVGLRFLYLMTDKNMKYMNEFEKHFSVDLMTIKDHKLIVLNDVKAVDENGDIVDFKVRKIAETVHFLEIHYFNNLLNIWSQSVVRDVKTIIYGNQLFPYLKDIGIESVDSIPDRCQAYWSPNKCFEFTDRLFDFIKNCVTDEMTLYELTFDYLLECVSCERYQTYNGLSETYFLPKFYTK